MREYTIESIANDSRIKEVMNRTGEVDSPDTPFVVEDDPNSDCNYPVFSAKNVVGIVPEGLRHLFHYVDEINESDVGINDKDEKERFVIAVRHYFFHLLRKKLESIGDGSPLICRDWRVVVSD